MEEERFCGLALLTRPGQVMAPRSATEQVVSAALQRIADRRARVVDVGTGSGAIAIAIASASSHAEVWATDTNPAAIALARANVVRHGLGNRVVVRPGDLLEPVAGPIDLIVANLPYLPAADALRHPQLACEPSDAIFAPGDGLGPYRRLLSTARERLADGGAIVIQLHRRVFSARYDELAELGAEIEQYSVPTTA
jgi:release factor glutamine methyltransferase